MKKLVSICFVLIASIIGTSFLYASSRAGTATFSLGAGPEFFAKKRHIENTGVPFGTLGYNFTQHWGVEGFLGMFLTTYTPRERTDHNKDIKGALFLVDGIYHFSTPDFIEPYLLGGAGVTRIHRNRHNANNEGNVNIGAGVNLFANNKVALRVEGRDIYTLTSKNNDLILDAGVIVLWDLC